MEVLSLLIGLPPSPTLCKFLTGSVFVDAFRFEVQQLLCTDVAYTGSVYWVLSLGLPARKAEDHRPRIPIRTNHRLSVMRHAVSVLRHSFLNAYSIYPYSITCNRKVNPPICHKNNRFRSSVFNVVHKRPCGADILRIDKTRGRSTPTGPQTVKKSRKAPDDWAARGRVRGAKGHHHVQ